MILFFLAFYTFSLTQDQIYQKILSDKFFRGIVADNLCEDKEFVSKISCVSPTYSEMRACVIRWIEENPEEASKIFKGRVEEQGGFKIQSVIYEYYLNPYVKDLIDKMEDAAKGYRQAEVMRELASYLFEANFNDHKGVVETPNFDKNNEEGFQNNEIQYYKLNKKAFLDEVALINKVAGVLSDYNVKDLKGIVKSSDEYISKAMAYLLTLKNLTMITPQEFRKLTDTLANIKKRLILKAIIIHLRMVERDINRELTEEKVLNGIINLAYSNYELSDFVEKSSQIWREIEQIYTAGRFLSESRALAKRIRLYYSCFLDYLISLIHRYLIPVSFYKTLDDELERLKIYFSNIEANTLSDSPRFLEYKNNYNKLLRTYEKNSQTGRFHRIVQYIIWDNLIPFDIFFTADKRYFGLKLSYEILSNHSQGYSILARDDRP